MKKEKKNALIHKLDKEIKVSESGPHTSINPMVPEEVDAETKQFHA